jgi:ribosomal protein S18 acetylase RimI-like enzyme
MLSDSVTRVRFRCVELADLAELEQMVFALYREDEYGQPITSEKIRMTVDELSRNPQRGKIVIFTLEGAIVGYAILIYYWSNEYGGELVTVDELYVKVPWRNRGIGTRFIDSLASNCPRGTVGVQLEVTPFNRRALAYYEKIGFRRSGNTFLMKLL